MGWNPEVVDVPGDGGLDNLPLLQDHVSEIKVLAELQRWSGTPFPVNKQIKELGQHSL